MDTRRLTALLGLFLLAFSAHGAESTSPARQPLWSVEGKSNTVYLLGSVHFLSADEVLPAAADAAYADAEALLMELDMDDLNPAELQQTMLALGMLPEDDSLQKQLDAATFRKLEATARDLGLEPAVLNRFRPWFAAITLVQMHLMKMGLDPTSGVEQRLTRKAAADDKPIYGLETPGEQLRVLADLPMRQQREFLAYTIEDAERMTQEIEALLAAWRRGDAQVLADLLGEGFDKYPELYRPLTVERNRKWIPRIEDLLQQKDDYLVVVGALHLVGEDSVIDLLERRGRVVKQH